jgi:hypothetical protein
MVAVQDATTTLVGVRRGSSSGSVVISATLAGLEDIEALTMTVQSSTVRVQALQLPLAQRE